MKLTIVFSFCLFFVYIYLFGSMLYYLLPGFSGCYTSTFYKVLVKNMMLSLRQG